MPLSKLKISASGIPRRMGECDTILYNVGERLAPLKPKIAGALKTQLSNVALHKHSVVRTTYGKLHAVAALYLKGHIIGRERMRHRICLYGGEKLPCALPQPLPEQSAAANGCFCSMC